MRGTEVMSTRILLTGIAALFLTTGTAHAREWQGNMPKPIGKLPSYPPVVWRKTCDQAEPHRVIANQEHRGDHRGCRLGRVGGRRTPGDEQRDRSANEIG